MTHFSIELSRESVFDFKKKNFRKGLLIWNILLYPPNHRNNRVFDQHIDKFTLDPTGTSPVGKNKWIKQYFPNLSILAQGKLPGEEKLAFVYASVDNQFLGFPSYNLTYCANRFSIECI